MDILIKADLSGNYWCPSSEDIQFSNHPGCCFVVDENKTIRDLCLVGF